MRWPTLSSLGSWHGEKYIIHFISCIDIWNLSCEAGAESSCAQSHCKGGVMLIEPNACYNPNTLSECLCLCCWDLVPWKLSPICPFRLLFSPEVCKSAASFKIIFNSCFEICSPKFCLKCSEQHRIIVRTCMDWLTQGCTNQVEGIFSCIPYKIRCTIFLIED